MPTIKKDVQKTKDAKFGNPESYITPDDRQILKGIDWTRRKEELWERCGGQCEHTLIAPFGGTVRCSAEANDAHHKTLRSRRRNDALDALLGLCRRHHEIVDAEQRKERVKR